MSLGFYRVIKGKLLVRGCHSPDGDSMRFVADDMSLFQGLPNFSEPVGSGSAASYQLRFQAIDTPELHYGSARQPFGLESRNGFLAWLGVDPASWDWVVAPDGFEWEQNATILCDGFEGHGRPVAFVFPDIPENDGMEIKLTRELLGQSYNYHAVKIGLAYLGLYRGSLSSEIRDALIDAYQQAKNKNLGIWPLDRTSQFSVNTIRELSQENGMLIYPKIFRRCVDALRRVGGDFEPGRDLDDFLLAQPKENDRFVVTDAYGGQIRSRLSEVVEQINNQIRIQVDLNTVEFISK